MNHVLSNVRKDEEHLGDLAMKFRGTRHDEEREVIAKDYSQTVHRLIESGGWDEMPAPEDELPEEWMPKEYVAFWTEL
ncbi:MAG: hypothetical protein K8T89_27030 [Planctomycetes bacterium]|nr:hypothetical protein [Planctomycetota bacterium]